MPFPRELPPKPARVTHNGFPLLVVGGLVTSSALFYWILVKTNSRLLAPKFPWEFERMYSQLDPNDPRRILHEARKAQSGSSIQQIPLFISLQKEARQNAIPDPKPAIPVLADQPVTKTPPKSGQ